jgi:hypothetical protein
MAKNSKSGGTSRIRFVMVDAEIAEGDVGSITQAIQNALRGPVPPAVQRLSAPAKPVGTNGSDASEPEFELEAEAKVIEPEAAARRSRGPRKAGKPPKVVNIDMKSDPSLATFAQGKDAGSHHKRFMIAAAWLKEHRGIDAVSADLIYTCYKSMEWSTNVPDFAQPLRDLKAKHLFDQPAKGMYAINHIALDRVKRLGTAGRGS